MARRGIYICLIMALPKRSASFHQATHLQKRYDSLPNPRLEYIAKLL